MYKLFRLNLILFKSLNSILNEISKFIYGYRYIYIMNKINIICENFGESECECGYCCQDG